VRQVLKRIDSLPRPAGREPSLKIVAIGGGTGLSTLLRGLRYHTAAELLPERFPLDITAVVTVTDDGGSSGRLRRDFDVLAPGDIRNCMVALSEDEALMSRLFQYRFPAGRGLKGHSFGNLFLTALSNVTGDFPKAVRVTSEVLAIAGRIYPATAANVSLEAVLKNGTVVCGESSISKSRSPIHRIALRPSAPVPLPETLRAIAEADIITIGPGSLFTSIIPNLLVKGIPQAIKRSKALKACIVNLMWQPGETLGFTAADHVEAILHHSLAGLLDVAVVNSETISEPLRRKYARQRSRQVESDVERLRSLGLRVVSVPLVEQSAVVRHDPDALARVVLLLAGEGRRLRSRNR
jgi:uncharacterized cofD-like protein